MIKLVIFDLDGTLIDSAYDIYEAANHTLKFYGFEPMDLETVKLHIGEGFKPFVKFVAGDRADDRKYCDEVFLKFQSYYDKQLTKHTAFYAGVEKFLSVYMSQEGRKVGVISNKPEYQVRIILKGLGVSTDQVVEMWGGDTFEYKKPDPRPLHEMMKLAGVSPQETVMIGDSKADVHAAQAAGTHFIAVSFGYNSQDKLRGFGAQHFIDHFDELITKLEIFTDTTLV